MEKEAKVHPSTHVGKNLNLIENFPVLCVTGSMPAKPHCILTTRISIVYDKLSKASQSGSSTDNKECH